MRKRAVGYIEGERGLIGREVEGSRRTSCM
jgi:hypothetical protein